MKRGDSNGETQTGPPFAEQTLGAADAARDASASDSSDTPASSRPKGPKALEGGTHLSLVEVYRPEESREASARAALAALLRQVKDAGRRRLTADRQDEIVERCARVLEKNSDIEDQDLHYLLGLWAGDRALENANFLHEHMSRNKRFLPQVISDMEARGFGDDSDPEEWLKVGILHGQSKRAAYLQARAEAEAEERAKSDTASKAETGTTRRK